MNTLGRALVALGLARADTTGTATTPSPGVVPPSRQGAGVVTPRDAATLEAVYRAMFILGTAVQQITLDDVVQGYALERRPSLLARPCLDDTAGGFHADTVVSLACRGNAYWLATRGPDEAVINLDVLDPLQVHPFRDRGRTRGPVLFRYDGKTRTSREVIHVRLPVRLPGEIEALGPIQAAQRTLAGQIDVASYGSQWFTGSGIPNGVLSTDQHLNAAQAADWKAQWMGSVRGTEPAVLGQGLKYEPLPLKPSEVQWLESQRFGVTGIARLFGMTSRQMLAPLDGSAMTYSNLEQEDTAWARQTLMGYLRPVEEAFSTLTPRGHDARWNLEGYLRPDTLNRYKAHALGIKYGFLSADEVRGIEGIPGPAPDPAQTPSKESPDALV